MKKFVMTASLAAVAALGLMAMLGTAAASAKVCTTGGSGEACPNGNVIANGSTIDASISTPSVAVLTSGFIRVTCGTSTVKGSITSGSSGTGTISSLTFSDCHSNLNQTSESCTASTTATEKEPWSATTSPTGSGSGTMTVSNVTGTFTCNAGILGTPTCRYKASSATVTVNGGETASVVASEVPLELEATSSSSCSATSKWDGTYTVTTPDSLWVY